MEDGKMLSSLVEKAEKKGKKPNRAIADGSYDSRKNFNYLNSNGIEPVIKTRKDASTRARGSPSRAKMVRERKEIGYEGWRDKYKYGKRWMKLHFQELKENMESMLVLLDGRIW